MNRLLPLVVAFLCAPLFAQAPSQVAPAAALKVTARAERADATYQVGEKVSFTVSVEDKGKPANGSLIDWVIVKDGLATEQKGFSSVVDGKATVVGSLNEPGFLQLKVTAHRLDARSKPLAVSAMAGAAVRILRRHRTGARPPDLRLHGEASRGQAQEPAHHPYRPWGRRERQFARRIGELGRQGVPRHGYERPWPTEREAQAVLC